MRVISGKYRGKPLASFEGKDIRPTIDRIKESIFNVIQFDIENSNFLDLFCRTGSMGIEALSRGANVIFNDLKTSSLNILNANLKSINESPKVLNKDYKDALLSLKEKQDFIFIDAPYKMDCIDEILKIVKERDLLNEDGLIIYEHDKNKEIETGLDFYISKSKNFGIVVVDYIKKCKKVCALTGSFDPITIGHVEIIERAKENFDKILVLVAQNEQKASYFSLQERMNLIKELYKGDNKICVDICYGFVYEYLNSKKIDIIVRGYRTKEDLKYEQVMSEYNKEHGGVDTLLYKAQENVDVSSSKVRQLLENNEPIKGLVPSKILNKILKTKRGKQL